MQDEHPIKRLRGSKTQAEFGPEFGLSQNRLSEIENGSPISADLALRLWEAFGHRLRGMGFSFERFVRRCTEGPSGREPFRPASGEAA